MGFFGVALKPGQKEAVEVPEGWILQLCSAALEPPPMKKPKSNAKVGHNREMNVQCSSCTTGDPRNEWNLVVP